MGKDCAQALVGRDDSPVALVGQPLHPRRQRRGDDIDLLCLVDERTNRLRDLVGVG
jgi:hypothetical protein